MRTRVSVSTGWVIGGSAAARLGRAFLRRLLLIGSEVVPRRHLGPGKGVRRSSSRFTGAARMIENGHALVK